jgi:Apea-like HEPN
LNLKPALNALESLTLRINRKLRRKAAVAKTSGIIRHEITSDFVMFSNADLGGLALVDEDAAEYRRVVESIHSEVTGKAEHISRSAVESAIQKAILAALDVREKAAERVLSKRLGTALAALKQALAAETSLWELHFPIAGLLTAGLPRTFGGCEFYFGDDAYLKSLLSRVDRIIASLVQPKWLEDSRRDAAARTTALVKDKTGLSVKVHAVDREAAQTIGRRVARQTVDILNFYANLGRGPRAEVLLFAEGRGPGALYTFLFAEQPAAFQTPVERFGPEMPFSFNLPQLVGTGFERVSGILAKPEKDRTQIEDKLLSALQWAGRASVDPRTEESFLLYAIALESLLMELEGADRSEITEKLALRGAHLIAGNLKSRMIVYHDLKRLYSIRSKVVHSGSVDVGEAQLSEIRYYARLALLTTLTAPSFSVLTSKEELVSLFRRRILGARSRKRR